ncbi:MAG: iron ABC transporter permease [Candidatus Sumerlaeia bacterium]|nr:iron ABC transporter permease [Candidatus Sumerlaeia bacterium]
MSNPRLRPILGLVALLVILVVVVMTAPLIGTSSIDLGRALDTSIPREENVDRIILFDLRLARVAFAALVGMTLAMAGCVFQATLRNDLATPYTLGVSGGSSLGALLVMRVGGFGPLMAMGGVAGGVITVAAILWLARRFRGAEGTVGLLLAGVTLNLLFSSMILVLQYLADPYETYAMLRWLMGGLDVVGLGLSLWLAPVLLLGALFLWSRAHAMNLLSLDDRTARSLGINPDRQRLASIGVAAMMTALAVSFAGPIGFVGLILPHGIRRILGGDHRFVLPGCALGGAAFLVLADLVGRMVGGDAELPVGIVTALIGGPVFLWILLKKQLR